MTWSYDLADLSTVKKEQVRFLIGDTNGDDPQLEDEEIALALALGNPGGSILIAAATCCQSLATRFSRRADTVTGELRTVWSSQARAYAARAQEFSNQEEAGIGFAVPYAGGISIDDKRSRESNVDRVPPDFDRALTDNYNMPVPPVGKDRAGG